MAGLLGFFLSALEMLSTTGISSAGVSVRLISAVFIRICRISTQGSYCWLLYSLWKTSRCFQPWKHGLGFVSVLQKLSLQLIIIYPSIPIDNFINKINDWTGLEHRTCILSGLRQTRDIDGAGRCGLVLLCCVVRYRWGDQENRSGLINTPAFVSTESTYINAPA